MIDPRSIALALGGEVHGRGVSAPGPGHSPHDRSLSVRPSPSAPDGFVCFSHAGDDWRRCRDYVRQRLGLPEWHPGDERDRRVDPRHHREHDRNAADRDAADDRPLTEDQIARIKRAVEIWDAGCDPRGTVAQDYLRSRCLELPDDLAGTVLRFNPRTPWRSENTGRTDFIPCLIVPFRSIERDEIMAVHRIRLDRPERWPKVDRRMLGIMRHVAVKLSPASDILVVGEGVETGLAARQLGLAPVWAMGSTGLIERLPVIEGVERLSILMETGEASEEAANIVGLRWLRAGRRVTRIRPTTPGASDMNDAIMIENGRM